MTSSRTERKTKIPQKMFCFLHLILFSLLHAIIQKEDQASIEASPNRVSFVAGAVFGAGVTCLSFRYYPNIQYRWNRSGRRMLTSGNVNFQQRLGTFEEHKTELLNLLNDLISEDAFNRLRTALGFSGNQELTNLEMLMNEAVASNSIVAHREEICFTYFFAKVDKFLKSVTGIDVNHRIEISSKVFELTRLCYGKDILLMYGKDDSDIAGEIKETMEQMNISVDDQSEFGVGKSVFDILAEGFEDYMLIFVIVTKNLQDDRLRKFLAQGQLFNSFRDKHNRLIPVKIEGESSNSAVFGQYNPWVYDNTDESKRSLVSIMKHAPEKVFDLSTMKYKEP